jgi:LysM repeat protein
MSRFLTSLLGAALAVPVTLHADSIELREIRELRQIVEQQSKQIEALTQHVNKLSEALEHQKLGPPSPAANAAPETPTPPAPAPATTPPSSVPDAPRAEAVPKHTVAKGETLTSIAKLYNITVSELQKVNKIENDRKLQIGQTLTIPAAKNPESTTEKKENP